jgi:hypothetical protein
MKHFLLIILFSISGYSQSISKQIIGSAGKTETNSNHKMTYTVGETVIGVMTAGGSQLGNGYYPGLDLQVLSVEDNTLDVQIKVYPNPTSKSLYVYHPDLNSFTIYLVDLNGKLLYQGNINKEEPLDISNYTVGMYLLTIENNETKQKNIYKIIKK